MIAMSGGVDSSVAALLTIRLGYSATGATMRLLEHSNTRDISDAQSVCRRLGIGHTVFDLREEFDREVMRRFADTYLSGETPNPCIVCNKTIKFGVLLESIRRYGDFEHTNFVILGDHGQQDITMDLNVNILLRDAGFIRCDEQGKLVDYDAYCHSVSMSAWIQLKDPNDKVMREKVYDFLKSLKDDPKYNIGYLYTKEEADELFGLTGPLDFVIEGKEPMAFSSTLEGKDAFEKYLKPGQHRSVASHGHLPWRDETTTFIAVGPNVAENVVIERSSMLNEAPTMAAMLGLQMENIDGHILEELIRK